MDSLCILCIHDCFPHPRFNLLLYFIKDILLPIIQYLRYERLKHLRHNLWPELLLYFCHDLLQDLLQDLLLYLCYDFLCDLLPGLLHSRFPHLQCYLYEDPSPPPLPPPRTSSHTSATPASRTSVTVCTW